MLSSLYAKTKDILVWELEKKYSNQWFAIVNFLYFANAVQYHLLDSPQIQSDNEKKYAASLQDSDFLLPDGIALQIWYRYFGDTKTWVQNLNGTDLTPYILQYFASKYIDNVEIFVYSLYDESIGKWQERLHIGKDKLVQQFGIKKIYAYQSHYNDRWKDFPREIMQEHCNNSVHSPVRIFLNCTWSPFQENRVYEHKKWFIDNNMIVLNVWWFLDFFSGFEKRAPERVVKARVLETFWRITTNPKKNLKKFLAMFGVISVLRRKIISLPKQKHV